MTAQTVDNRNVDEQISRTVNALRGYNDLTVKALAAETGIDEDTLRRRLHGSTWQASEVYRLALYFGIDVQRFYEPLPKDLFGQRKNITNSEALHERLLIAAA